MADGAGALSAAVAAARRRRPVNHELIQTIEWVGRVRLENRSPVWHDAEQAIIGAGR